MQKSAIISGNGPSIKTIDYSLMPKVYDVFRCNQFYIEDKYYLGKNIKAVGFATQTSFEQIFTMLHLKQNKEYEIESIFLRDLFYPKKSKDQNNISSLLQYFDNNAFIQKIYKGPLCLQINDFLEYTKIQELYFGKHVTTGILLCAIAIAMGYKTLYLVGIDLYEGKQYAFNPLQENILKIMPDFKRICTKTTNQGGWHTKEADLEALEFLRKHYDVEIYSLCPTSPLSQFIPLAPKTNLDFILQDKPKDYIKDILIPNDLAYKKLGKISPMGGGVLWKCKSIAKKFPWWRGE